MKNLAPGITVNGIRISTDEINAEVQYHPAENLANAKYEAMKALVVREILLQRAVELHMCTREDSIRKPDEIIDVLLEKEISVPQADEATCLHYYTNNMKRFVTSPLFEVSHILYLAPADDGEARKSAHDQAERAIEKLRVNPSLFETLARAESACSSAGEGGRIGQISKGQTSPAFEAALLRMKEDDMSLVPVATEVGYHVIKVHKRIEGAQLPFEAVSEWIRDYLTRQSWNRAVDQYIQLLAGRCEISGFRFEGAKTPLVQ